MASALNSVWAKIQRAKEHRDALDSYIKETFAVEGNRPRLGAKFEPDTEEYVLYVSHMPALPGFFDRVSLILGDALINMRAGLDHLAFQLARWYTEGNLRKERQVQFPIADTAQAFQHAKKRYLSEVHPDHIAIIERFQGYHRIHGEVAVGLYFHPLTMLRDLSDTDKHRLLTTVMIPSTGVETMIGVVAIPIFLVGFMQETILRSIQHNPVELGTEITRVKLPNGLLQKDMDMAGYVAPQVALAEGRPIVAVIDKIAAVVVKVVREFEPLL